MPKFREKPYYIKNGERKINNYEITLPKKYIEAAGFENGINLKATAQKGRIILEPEKQA